MQAITALRCLDGLTSKGRSWRRPEAGPRLAGAKAAPLAALPVVPEERVFHSSPHGNRAGVTCCDELLPIGRGRTDQIS